MSVSRRAGGEPGVNLFRIAKQYIFSLFENKYRKIPSDETLEPALLLKEMETGNRFPASVYRELYLGLF